MKAAFSLLCATLPLVVQAQNKPTDWIYFDSRETQTGPKLALELGNGKRRLLPAAADSVLISYLAERAWGRLPRASVSMGDTNRVLVRFDLDGLDPVRKAELVLELHLSEVPPSGPFELAIHAVTSEWDERTVTRQSQPSFVDKPALTIEVAPRPGTLHLPVTELVNRVLKGDAPNHGWLLKVARPVAGLGSDPPETKKLEGQLLALLPWEDSLAAARRKATQEGKLVLAVVRGVAEPSQSSLAERLLLVTCCAHPDVRGLIDECFVPVRIHYKPIRYTWPAGRAAAGMVMADPLRPLGTSLAKTKALALVVARGEGKHVATLENIGTFDPHFIWSFLVGAAADANIEAHGADPWKLLAAGRLVEAKRLFRELSSDEGRYGLCRAAALSGDHETALKLASSVNVESGRWAAGAQVQRGVSLMRLGRFDEAAAVFERAASARGERAAEAAYYLGCLLWRDKRAQAASREWQRIIRDQADSPFALPAKARLLWAEQLAMYENLAAVELPRELNSTEVPVARAEERQLVRGALDYLLTQQNAGGSWSGGAQEPYRAAVTALVAQALVSWKGEVAEERQPELERALARAGQWLARYVSSATPKHTNSFSAAYVLDFYLACSEGKAVAEGDVVRAVELLLGGQCPDGAWSYNQAFATNWKGGFGGWPKTDKGRTHSMNTGLALLVLRRARDMGFEVDAEVLDRGRRALLAMRQRPGVYTYTYPEPICFAEPDQSIARGPLCEQALRALGAASEEDLEEAVRTFMRYRKALRTPTKLTQAWLPPHMYPSYFYFFAYYHAARAIRELGGEDAGPRLARLRDDLLQVVEADGTWIDDETIGKPYGTAMALLVLHLARDQAP